MKCKFLIALLVLLISISPLIARAHPGNTDGSGGHYDKSSGEYHYHHGYTAHQHYDMNGDGIRDCPYNFNDRTGQNSGSSEDNNSSSSKYSSTSSGSTWSVWNSLVEFFTTAYGIFCIVAVFLQLVLYIFTFHIKSDSDASCLLSIVGVILYTASLPVSGSLMMIIFLIGFPLWSGLKKLAKYLAKKKLVLIVISAIAVFIFWIFFFLWLSTLY